MADIRKSFSFREGLQVDNDILVVSGALVGVGTTIPTEKLEVKGNFKVSGLSTLTTLAVSGVSSFNSDVRIGSGITFEASTGDINATTFYGSAAGLTGFYAVAVDGWYVDTPNSGIFTSFKVGIGTTTPQSAALQIGGNPDNTQYKGLTINFGGGVKSSGIITAKSFTGIGSEITEIRGENITLGTISNSVLPIINNDRLPSNINVSGIITAQTTFSGNLVGIATTARSLTGTPNITVGVVTSGQINATSINSPLVVSGISSTGILTASTSLQVGSGSTELRFTNGRLGIGTNLPTTDIQVFKSTNATIEVVSASGESKVSIGQSVGVGNSTGIIRFGNTKDTFEFLNNGIGDFNFYLHSGSQTGINTGSFKWIHKGSVKLSLTYDGKLGIGITNPTNDFHVVGTSTVTGNSFVGGDFSTPGTITFGSGSSKSTLGLPVGNTVLSNVNLNATSGVTTLSQLLISTPGKIGFGTTNPISEIDVRTGSGLFNNLGVATSGINTEADFYVYGTSLFDNIGIGTVKYNLSGENPGKVQLFNAGMKFYGLGAIFFDTVGGIGFNTDQPGGAIDMSRALALADGTRTVFIPPVLSSIERTGIGVTPTGAMIFNDSTNKFQGWDGTAWRDFH